MALVARYCFVVVVIAVVAVLVVMVVVFVADCCFLLLTFL